MSRGCFIGFYWFMAGRLGAGSVVDGSGVECVGIIDRSGGSELNSGG